VLDAEASADLRDQLFAEIATLASEDAAAVWAHRTLATKNTLADGDAQQIEEAFSSRLTALGSSKELVADSPVSTTGNAVSAAGDSGDPMTVTAISGVAVGAQDSADRGGARAGQGGTPAQDAGPPADAAVDQPAWLGPPDPAPSVEPRGVDKSELPIGAPRRLRDKTHLAFVAAQPCLLCAKRPSDPHHVRFAQKQSLGRKVSDEFTVPLCRSHHRALHRSGSEYLWWENVGIDPLKAARKLWRKTRPQRGQRAEQRKNRDTSADDLRPS
jgi:hypothetical protein